MQVPVRGNQDPVSPEVSCIEFFLVEMPSMQVCTLDHALPFSASFTDQTQAHVSLPTSQSFIASVSHLLFPARENKNKKSTVDP